MSTNDEKSPYVDYEYYSNDYHGSVLTADEFPHAEIEAEAYVNAITFGRIPKLETIPGCVKNAICCAAEAAKSYMDGLTGELKSESNDGYSYTYADAMTEEQCQSAMMFGIKKHLANTGLLYKGWSSEYDG